MNSSPRALQTNEKLLVNFKFVFKIFAENQKIFNEELGVNIDQVAMCYISI